MLACAAAFAPAISAALTNGSFEDGLNGWDSTGNVAVKSAPPYAPTHGTALVAFNSANTVGDAALFQELQTETAHSYRIDFDVGNLGYNPKPQKIDVLVGGVTPGLETYTLARVEVEIPGTTGGRTNWLARSITFTPRPGLNPILAIWDRSTISDGLDLVLDNLRMTDLGELPPPELPNGGFESDFDGWTVSGNVAVYSIPPYLATEGVKLAVFNSGNTEPNGSLSRWIATVPGQQYRLQFDAGALSYNQLPQRIGILLGSHGYKQHLVEDNISIAGPRFGATAWVAASYLFTAIDTATDLVLFDASTHTNATDLVLDNVRITLASDTNMIHNGSFESDLAGWNHNILPGKVAIKSQAPYVPTDGAKLVAFGTQNTSNAGWVDQFVTTVPGVTYRLLFDVGNLSFASGVQVLRVQVDGAGQRQVNLPFTIPSTSSTGGTNWFRNRFVDFTAIDTSTRVIFLDDSPVTNGIDLVLDHIRMAPR